MQKTILLVLFLTTTGLVFAQSNRQNYTEDELRSLATMGPNTPGVRAIDNRYQGVQGSPLFTTEWKKGTFKLKEKEDFGKEVEVNIDLMEHVLYFRLNNGFVGSLPSTRVTEFKIEKEADEFYLFRVAQENEIEGTSKNRLKFYEVLFDGDIVLLKHHYKEFIKADYKGAYSTDRRYDEYDNRYSYWIKEGNKDYQKVRLKRKSLEQALPNSANKIQKIIKSEKLDLKNDADLIRLIEALTQS